MVSPHISKEKLSFLLVAIQNNPGIGSSELRRITGISKTALSRGVNWLASHNKVRIGLSGKNRRLWPAGDG